MELKKNKVSYTVDMRGVADDVAESDKYVIMTFTHRGKQLSQVRFMYDQWLTFIVRYGQNHSAYDCYKMVMSCAVKMN